MMKAVMPQAGRPGRRRQDDQRAGAAQARRVKNRQTFHGVVTSNRFERHAQASHPSSIRLLSTRQEPLFVSGRPASARRAVRASRIRTNRAGRSPIARQGALCYAPPSDMQPWRQSVPPSTTPFSPQPSSDELTHRPLGRASSASRRWPAASWASPAKRCMAAIFGAGSGPEMDAFNVAFRVPNLLRDLFAEGAMTAAFVPTFTRDADHARPRGRLASRQPRHQRAARS